MHPLKSTLNADQSSWLETEPTMAMDGSEISKITAIVACTSMTLLYVAILYTPTFVLGLPPPDSFKSFMIRRFICAAVSSVVSLILCAFILPVSVFVQVLFAIVM